MGNASSKFYSIELLLHIFKINKIGIDIDDDDDDLWEDDFCKLKDSPKHCYNKFDDSLGGLHDPSLG